MQNRRVGIQKLFNLTWKIFFTPPIDHFFAPPYDHDVSGLINVFTKITSSEPIVIGEQVFVGIRVIEVAQMYRRPVGRDFAF